MKPTEEVMTDKDGYVVVSHKGFDYWNPDYFVNDHAHFQILGFNNKHTIALSEDQLLDWHTEETRYDEFVVKMKSTNVNENHDRLLQLLEDI